MSFLTTSEMLPPVRGLVPLCNHRGIHFNPVDVRRWFRLNRLLLKTLRVDVFAPGQPIATLLETLEFARDIDLSVSLRTACESQPPDLRPWCAKGLSDVYLTPRLGDWRHWSAWLAACKEAKLPARVQLMQPWRSGISPEELAQTLLENGTVLVNIAACDALLGDAGAGDPTLASADIAYLEALLTAFAEADLEFNLLGYDDHQLSQSLQPFALSQQTPGFDSYTYQGESFAWAVRLRCRSINAARIALLIKLTGDTSRLNRVDNLVFQFLLHKREWLLDRWLFLHKLTRFSAFFAGRYREREATGLAVPERVSASAGAGRCRYVDEVDRRRLDDLHLQREWAREALTIMGDRAHDRELGPESCHASNGHSESFQDALRWYSGANVEKLSNELGPFSAPVTLAYTAGGGHAECLGFAVGTYGRVVCPMEDVSHTLVLHVRDGGAYVLLRDGQPVCPVDFDGPRYAPLRLPGQFRVRLALSNIDGTIVTQPLRVWHGAGEGDSVSGPLLFSVVIVSSRYARRLQACLLALAQQRDFDAELMEILVAHVPGADATEDVLDSMQQAYPRLRIRRVPFDARHMTSKGLMLNETVRCAIGEWVILMDADILLPPRFLAELRKAAADAAACFLAPDGRKMVDSDTTARILLGQIDPYACWDWLLAGPGEFRFREAANTPVGYCQVVRRACFDEVRYPEYPHFEGADYTFAHEIQGRFGRAIRLEGMPVVHLDHGPSQWYGARRHF